MQCNHSPHSCLHIVPLFQNLDTHQLQAISDISVEKHYSHNQIIYHAGDLNGPLLVVNTGKIKIYRLDIEGNEQVMRILHPGEFTNELSLFSKEPLQDYAQAIGECSICMIDGQLMQKIMVEYPLIALKITLELSHRLIERDAILHSVVKGSVDQRLANYLVDLMTKQDSSHIQLPVSKGTIASLLAMSQETLSRRLKLFQEEGVIDLEKGKKIIILDREALIQKAMM
ncbi:MAG: Crp/Fnr family transcriptional regulator [Spirochaetia bacterium]|nr:Crp/Fnr family transcriptional regulator [Spirochaetia bacterium]